jgi:transposase
MTHQGIVVSQFLLLPELEVLSGRRLGGWGYGVEAFKRRSEAEYCPRCATASSMTYDTRTVQLKDHPVRDKLVILRVRKRRYFCRPCKKPFTESLPGVRKGDRCTERYRKGLRWAAENFSDLRKVQKYFRCSSSALYRDVYRQLELRRRRRLSYPWPEKIGIDEHSFRRHPVYQRTEYSTILVDHDHHRVYELLQGKQSSELFNQLKDVSGAERVKHVTMDLSEGYRSLAHALFPNAAITADKFHVLRLLIPAINRRRKRQFGSVHHSPVGRLLLRSAKNLDFATRSQIDRSLKPHQELAHIYRFKERLHELYRCRGVAKATQSFNRLLQDLQSHRQTPELATLARTLGRWREEILNYFWTGMTNARTEGFNTTAKLVKRRAYGYKNHEHYRLRLLDACFG